MSTAKVIALVGLGIFLGMCLASTAILPKWQRIAAIALIVVLAIIAVMLAVN